MSSVVDGIDQTVDGLDRVGPPPLPGDDQARGDLLKQFASVRSRADTAREHLDTATDASATKTALGVRDARATLDDVAALNVLEGLNATPELSAAESGRRTASSSRRRRRRADGALRRGVRVVGGQLRSGWL